MSETNFRVGDRIVWIGEDYGPGKGMPRPGEQGTVESLHPMDDLFVWDEAGPMTGSLREMPLRIVTDEDASQ